MDPLTLMIGAIVAMASWVWGRTAGAADYDDAHKRAKAERDRLSRQAREDAIAALERAQRDLEIQLGALGTVTSGGELGGQKGAQRGKYEIADEDITYAFESYDEWYTAQEEEYAGKVEAGEYTGSWQDYLREQQVGELGQYGIERANLELQVMIARRELELAREDVAAQYEFAEWMYDEGVIQSNRLARGEGAAVGAMGVRGGTMASTATENQRVRMAELELFMNEQTWQRDYRTMQLNTQEYRIGAAETIAFAGLDQALANARSGYELAVGDINRGYRNYMENLNASFDTNFNDQARRRASRAGGMQGLAWSFDVFATGASVGAWGFNAGGEFWSVLGGGK